VLYIRTNIHLWSYLSEFLRERKICQTKFVEKAKAHILYSITFIWKRALCEIVWKNTVKPDRPEMTIMRIRIACWITNATNTHSEYEILTALPPLQWLHEHVSILRYTYMACPFFTLWHKLKNFRKNVTEYKTSVFIIWWGKFSQIHKYKYMTKWWCLLAVEKTTCFAL